MAPHTTCIATPPGLSPLEWHLGEAPTLATLALTECVQHSGVAESEAADRAASPMSPETPQKHASARTRARALLRAKTRQRRRESAENASDDNGSPSTTATVECENDKPEEISPSSGFDSPLLLSIQSTTVADIPDISTMQAEMRTLRMQIVQSERGRAGATEEILSLKRELTDTWSYCEIQRDELVRLMTQNRLLLNEWQEATEMRRALQLEHGYLADQRITSEAEMTFLREKLQGDEERTAAMCSLKWLGLQTVPVPSH